MGPRAVAEAAYYVCACIFLLLFTFCSFFVLVPTTHPLTQRALTSTPTLLRYVLCAFESIFHEQTLTRLHAYVNCILFKGMNSEWGRRGV